MKKFTVLDLLDLDLKENDALSLKCVAGRQGLGKEITLSYLDRPGLALIGFFDDFTYQRIQIFGKRESSFIQKMEKENNLENIEKFFSYQIPCCIFSTGLHPGEKIKAIASKAQCPLLETPLSSTELTRRLARILGAVFAPKQTIYGVLVEVYGIGILIQGKSGVGKSETALELIERGHRLIADDIVEVRNVYGNSLVGRGNNQQLAHHMEIRGLGIINITHLYGVGAVRDQKEIQLVVNLEEWDNNKEYNRLGTDDITTDILGIQIPSLVIPVKPGRNIPIIIETAAMNERLKSMGYFSAKEFNRRSIQWLEAKNISSFYNNEHKFGEE
ncbi:MAG: HPr(Ser) kinase/phosphatase [Spirochaetia bacterium]|nr:HPr(Ser) kinase/phosphatase [Spirochaetia bacterium]